jgi:hypothetical protein
VTTIGKLGAKRQQWFAMNPNELLARIVRNNVGLSEEQLRELFFDAFEERYLGAVLEYWFANNYRRLTAKRATPEERAEARREIEDRARAIFTNLLDYALPGGKLMRNATKADLERAGSWYADVARVLKPGQTVGKHLSLQQLQDIWTRHHKRNAT